MKKGKTVIHGNRAGLEDEFSSQPASSSSIGGKRGQQEYGIHGEVANEQGHKRAPVVFVNEDDVGGISDYALRSSSSASIEETTDIDNEPNRRVKQRELRAVFADRLKKHPVLKNRHIELEIAPTGEIVLAGEVETVAEKMEARELAEAVAEQIGVENKIRVQKESPGAHF